MKNFALFLAILSLGFVGCEKEADPIYRARVRVVNIDGIPIQNADIRIDTELEDPLALAFYSKTDIEGYVYFSYRYKAIFDVTATKGFGFLGCGYVELFPDEEVESIITIYPPNSGFTGCR
jgi:hypothetical protein